jgi:hypothetical protein
MTQPPKIRALPRPLTILRPLAMATVWLTMVGFATGCFFAPKGVEAQPTSYQVFAFGGALGIAGVVAATSALAIGGRRRWAVELAISAVVLSGIVALLLAYFLWYNPTLVRRRMNLWSLVEIQQGARSWAEQIAGFYAPLGAAVGITLGTIAGLLTRLGRRMPRLATGIALVVLFVVASAGGQQFLFSCVRWLSWNLLYPLIGWGSGAEAITITGMILGGTVGSVIAGLTISSKRPRSSVAPEKS